ncbi:Dolichyl-diphosphooligosaccharide--protein glycosyltransferase subunit 4C [Acorus calamus]|uniref:Dolichyl-diphosphooligosaccharide--protein glycosyltransferase subunit 4C n=1 Tax=Acorus calamus TaxID=4465 RepID=A0AAV9FBV0_ACOCL|nr:Dolichyl-diphosphooligosaccharide--protein glycosyltransferase subunit 4C [Acorus calamus]
METKTRGFMTSQQLLRAHSENKCQTMDWNKRLDDASDLEIFATCILMRNEKIFQRERRKEWYAQNIWGSVVNSRKDQSKFNFEDKTVRVNGEGECTGDVYCGRMIDDQDLGFFANFLGIFIFILADDFPNLVEA